MIKETKEHMVDKKGIPTWSFLSQWLGLIRVAREKSKKKNLRTFLYDETTGLPTLLLFSKQIQELLLERGQLGLLCVDIIQYSKVEKIYGWPMFDEVMKEIANSVKQLPTDCLRDVDIVIEPMISGNAFVILLSPPRTKSSINESDLIKAKRRVVYYLTDKLKQKFTSSIHSRFDCYVGGTIVRVKKRRSAERLIYQGLREALQGSYLHEQGGRQKKTAELKKIVQKERVSVFFQPVVNLVTHQIFGYEALSRGPAGTDLEQPRELFKAAYRAGLAVELDRVCRKKAIQAAKDMNKDYFLFVNIESESVDDPELAHIANSNVLIESSINLNQFILEVTESSVTIDVSLVGNRIARLRSLGFGVSVDDVEVGHGSLELVAEVKPDFIKVGSSLIREIDKSVSKQELVRMFVNFTQTVGTQLVAEGIETLSELGALLKVGVKLGQGYLFAYPSNSFGGIKPIKWPAVQG